MAEGIAAVEVLRSGGFAGIRRARRTEGAALTAAQRRALDALMQQGVAPAAAGGADRFSFAFVIHGEDGTEHRLDVPETAVPPALEGLLP